MQLPSPWSTPLVSVPVAGRLLGLSRSTAYRAAAGGQLPVVILGGGPLVPTAALYGLLGLPVPGRPISPSVSH